MSDRFKVIIGSYRGPELVRRAIESLVTHLKGEWDVVIVDDSARSDWGIEFRKWARARPYADDGHGLEVVHLPAIGYTNAMRQVCLIAGDDAFMFWEEDFILLEDVHLEEMLYALHQHPELAQLALLRGPHFAIEHREGGLLEGLVKRLGSERVDLRLEGYRVGGYTTRNAEGEIVFYDEGYSVGLFTQRGTFTCNPAVWAPGIAAKGWPDVDWSEDAFRDMLLAEGYRFGFLPGTKVAHDGVRSGHGY